MALDGLTKIMRDIQILFSRSGAFFSGVILPSGVMDAVRTSAKTLNSAKRNRWTHQRKMSGVRPNEKRGHFPA